MLFQVAIICGTFILLFNPNHHCHCAGVEVNESDEERINAAQNNAVKINAEQINAEQINAAQITLHNVEPTIIETANMFEHRVKVFKSMAREFSKKDVKIVKEMIERQATNLAAPFKALIGPITNEYKSFLQLRKKPKLRNIATYYAQVVEDSNPLTTQPGVRNVITAKIHYCEQVLQQFNLVYNNLEKMFTETNKKHNPELAAYAMLSAHDLLNNATKELRKLLLELLEDIEDNDKLAKELRPKRFAVWAIVEDIIKPVLNKIGDQIFVKRKLVLDFRAIAKQIENMLEISKDWNTAEARMGDKQQSTVRQNAGEVLLVYAQLKKWTSMFNFEVKNGLAARRYLAGNLLDNSISDMTYDFLVKTEDTKLQRLPQEFGELVYDEFIKIKT